MELVISVCLAKSLFVICCSVDRVVYSSVALSLLVAVGCCVVVDKCIMVA